MFAILVNSVFLNFWSNSPGDVFIENTIKGLKLPKDQVKLIHYPDLAVPEHFTIQEDNSLVVKEKVVTVNSDTQEEVISYNDLAIIPGDLYYENGKMVQTC